TSHSPAKSRSSRSRAWRTSSREREKPEENLELAGCASRYAAMLERMDRPVDAVKYRKQVQNIREAVEARSARSRDSQPWPESQAPRQLPEVMGVRAGWAALPWPGAHGSPEPPRARCVP